MQDDQNGRYSFQHMVFKFGRKKKILFFQLSTKMNCQNSTLKKYRTSGFQDNSSSLNTTVFINKVHDTWF